MTFEEYQSLSRTTAKYPDAGSNFVYPALGLAGEAGEVADQMKKIIRDDSGKIEDARKKKIISELGDVLWYVAQLSIEVGSSLEEVAEENIKKLRSRKERGVISGDGGER